jgi:hypothetical protein
VLHRLAIYLHPHVHHRSCVWIMLINFVALATTLAQEPEIASDFKLENLFSSDSSILPRKAYLTVYGRGWYMATQDSKGFIYILIY